MYEASVLEPLVEEALLNDVIDREVHLAAIEAFGEENLAETRKLVFDVRSHWLYLNI